jgi:hypothetical protein
MKALAIGMASALLFAGCAADPKVDRTSLRLAKIETRLGVIEHELDKIHDYLDQNHTAVRVRIDNLKKSHETIKIQVEDHDKTIRGWQQVSH